MNYLVTWSGGLELPSYFGTDDLEQAKETYEKWAADVKQDDMVQLLDLTGETVEVLSQAYRSDEEQ